MKYKVSNYNLFNDKYRVIFNMISKNIMKFDNIHYNFIKSNQLVCMDHKDIKTLSESGIIISNEVDEYSLLKHYYYANKYDKTSCSYIIAPTLKCNFKCSYCFENNIDNDYKTMTENDILTINNFLTLSLPKLKQLNIRWMGGEPLIALDKIEKISKHILKLCKTHHISYSASMATNGSLLSDTILKKLITYKITKFQITLDGSKITHDRRRKYISGKGTWDDIIKNIKNTTKYLDVIVRVNIDKNNCNDFKLLLTALRDNLNQFEIDKITIFCRPTYSCKGNDTTYSMEEFYKLEKYFIKLTKDYNISYAFHPNMGCYLRCPTYHINSLWIGPTCEIYKCVGDLGNKDNSVGHINKNGFVKITKPSKYFSYLYNYDPFSIKECQRCKILPICLGKCIFIWEKSGNKINVGCIPEKRSLPDKFSRIIESEKELLKFKNKIIGEQ